MLDREAEALLLDALYELIDVSQALGLHAPTPAERTEVRSKVRALREHLDHTGTPAHGPGSSRLRQRIDALMALLEARHDTERWRSTRASLVEVYEQLQASLRTRPRGRLRVKPHNLRRSLFHAGSGIGWALAYEYWLDRTQMILALSSFLVVFATDDVMRRWFPDRRGRFAVVVFQLLSRPSESDKVASSTWYTLGMLVGVLTLPGHAFLTGLLVLALADPAAALVGRRFGRSRLYRDKSVQGTASFFVVATAVALLVIARHDPGLGASQWLGSAVLIALAGTVAELLGDHVQDNVSILLTTGITAALVS